MLTCSKTLISSLIPLMPQDHSIVAKTIANGMLPLPLPLSKPRYRYHYPEHWERSVLSENLFQWKTIISYSYKHPTLRELLLNVQWIWKNLPMSSLPAQTVLTFTSKKSLKRIAIWSDVLTFHILMIECRLKMECFVSQNLIQEICFCDSDAMQLLSNFDRPWLRCGMILESTTTTRRKSVTKFQRQILPRKVSKFWRSL